LVINDANSLLAFTSNNTYSPIPHAQLHISKTTSSATKIQFTAIVAGTIIMTVMGLPEARRAYLNTITVIVNFAVSLINRALHR